MEYSDQTLYIHDLATPEGVNHTIDGDQFTNCVLRGPAVVTLMRTGASGGDVSIPGYDPATVILVTEEDRTVIPVGVVVIRDSHFTGCSFEGVTFLAQAEEAEVLKATFMSNVPQA